MPKEKIRAKIYNGSSKFNPPGFQRNLRDMAEKEEDAFRRYQ